jgi:hypothetical protein
MNERPTEHWHEKAADAIVREGKSLFLFSNEQDLGLTSRECDSIQKSKGFQETLRIRRNIYYKELANDPTLTRAALKGQLIFAITKMIENAQFDKAATAIMSFAKFEGWTSDGANVQIFNDLSHADLVKLREKFKPVGANPAN